MNLHFNSAEEFNAWAVEQERKFEEENKRLAHSVLPNLDNLLAVNAGRADAIHEISEIRAIFQALAETGHFPGEELPQNAIRVDADRYKALR